MTTPSGGRQPASSDVWPRCRAVGDSGLLVEFGTEVDDATNDAVIALDRAISAEVAARDGIDGAFDGVLEVVPAFVNLLVVFDPVRTDHQSVEAAIRSVQPSGANEPVDSRVHTIPVCYDDDFAPDLADVATACSMSVEAVVAAHVGAEYRVAMYGFAPGYAYLSGVDPAIRVPRKPAPMRGVAAQSVIIAGPQCLVTTLEMPTGWSVIGRSAVPILRPHDDHPFRFDVGDRVRFEQVDLATFERRRDAAPTATPRGPLS